MTTPQTGAPVEVTPAANGAQFSPRSRESVPPGGAPAADPSPLRSGSGGRSSWILRFVETPRIRFVVTPTPPSFARWLREAVGKPVAVEGTSVWFERGHG